MGGFPFGVQETFLNQRIKVDDRVNNLAGNITIAKETESMTIKSAKPITKRYMKYLTKKYMKKKGIRDFLRVISTSAEGYRIAYIQLDTGDADEE